MHLVAAAAAVVEVDRHRTDRRRTTRTVRSCPDQEDHRHRRVRGGKQGEGTEEDTSDVSCEFLLGTFPSLFMSLLFRRSVVARDSNLARAPRLGRRCHFLARSLRPTWCPFLCTHRHCDNEDTVMRASHAYGAILA